MGKKKGIKKESFSRILVLLCDGLKKDGHPSPFLLSSIQHATKLYRNKYYDKVIISGGSLGYDVSAADVAAVFLHNTIPKETIILERKSKNRSHQAVFIWELIKDKDVDKVTIVVPEVYLKRTKHIFNKIFSHTGFNLLFSPAKVNTGLFSRINIFIKEHTDISKLRSRGIE